MTLSINSLKYKREIDILDFIIVVTCLQVYFIFRAKFCCILDFKINNNNV